MHIKTKYRLYIDYCNSVLTGIYGNLMRRLQSLLKAAERLVFSARRSDHITPLVSNCRGLKVPEFRLGVHCWLIDACTTLHWHTWPIESLQLVCDGCLPDSPKLGFRVRVSVSGIGTEPRDVQ